MSVTPSDSRTTDTKPLDEKHLAEPFRRLIRHFPTALSSSASKVFNPTVEKITREKLRQWDLGTAESFREDLFAIGYHYTLCCYSHIQSPELLADIALLTGAVFIVDNGAVDLTSLQQFGSRLCAGLPQLHPLLDRLKEQALIIGVHYPDFSANIVVSGAIEFIASDPIPKYAMSHPTMMKYANYIRMKSGYGEAYTTLTWPKSEFPDIGAYIQVLPDTTEFVHFFNDVMSYYKEVLEGETGTYIQNFAAANQMNEKDALESVIDHVIAVVERTRDFLGEGKVRDAWESFVVGNVRYHLQNKRYRLAEILPELVCEDAVHRGKQ